MHAAGRYSGVHVQNIHSSVFEVLTSQQKMVLSSVQQFIADIRDPMDIYASFRPLLLICFLSGILPFNMIGSPGSRQLVVTVFGVANTVFHLVWFCTCYVLRIINKKSLLSYLFNSKVSRFGENIQIITSFMAIAFTLILCFLKRGKVRKLLHLLAGIDKELIALGANINYKSISRLIWIALTMQWLIKIAFILATFTLLRSLEHTPGFFEWIFFFLPFAIISTLKAQYVCITRLMKNRFSYINVTLKNLHRQASEDERQLNENPLRGSVNDMKLNRICEITCDVEKFNGGVDSSREMCDIIADLCRTHEKLCDACYLAEQYFSHQMLTMVTIEFVLTLFNFYFMFDVVYNKNSIPGIVPAEFFAYFTFYTLITTGTLYGVLRSAESVSNEVSSRLQVEFH